MDDKKAEQMPVLIELMKDLDNELGRFDGLTCELKAKCNMLLRLEEPSPAEKTNDKAGDVLGDFRTQLRRLQNYNQRLVEIQKHLNRIYN